MEKEKFLDLDFQRTKLTRFLESLESKERRQAFRALALADQQHSSQFRDSGAPYIIHPIRTALVLVEEVGTQDIDMLCAALLHDVVEDGHSTIPSIENSFGPEIARLVEGVTRVKPANETEEQKRENKLKKIQEIARVSEKIRIVKLCDILDNARSHKFIPETSPSQAKTPRWREELKHYLPIAEKTNKKLFEKLKQFSQ